MSNKNWLLIDGHNMAFRCFYAVPMMTTAQGLPVNAIQGWVRSVWKLEEMVNPAGVCVFFDAGGSKMRRDLLETYKANRKEMPSELKKQMQYLSLLSVAMGYYVFSEEGVEADDLLAGFAHKIASLDEHAYIASGDKDFAQCVNDHITQLMPPDTTSHGEWRVMDRGAVKEKFGVFPEQIVDYLSLLGDAADNIKGVPGIGKKRAERLLSQWGSVDNILQSIEQLSSLKIQQALQSSQEILKRNRQLIQLQISDSRPLPEPKISRSIEDIFRLLEELQLHALLTVAKKKYDRQIELFSF